jgi:dolichyl-phosphate beta-glucosyltransferase
VRRGLLAARGDLRLHCDADCGPSLASLPKLLEAIEAADVVVGSRLAPGAAVARRQPLRRRIVGRTYVDLCRLVLREPTHDLFCGFKLWRAPAAEAVFRHTRIDGWAFDAEALALARALGLTIAEVGIAWADRRGSRLSMTRTALPALAELTRARRHVRSAARSRPAAVEAPDAAG